MSGVSSVPLPRFIAMPLAHPRRLLLTATALVGAAAAVAFLALPALVQGRTEAQPRAVTPRGPLAADELAHIELFRKASPSVVHITSLGAQRDVFSMNVQQVPRGTGTGFDDLSRISDAIRIHRCEARLRCGVRQVDGFQINLGHGAQGKGRKQRTPGGEGWGRRADGPQRIGKVFVETQDRKRSRAAMAAAERLTIRITATDSLKSC